MVRNARLSVDVHFDEAPAGSVAIRKRMRSMLDRVDGVLNGLVGEFHPRQFRIPTRNHSCPP
jgi:hypothetical protein